MLRQARNERQAAKEASEHDAEKQSRHENGDM